MLRHALSLTYSTCAKTVISKAASRSNPHFRNRPTGLGSLDVDGGKMMWVGLEVTGVNPKNNKILEVACLVTDSELNIIKEGPDIIIHQPWNVLCYFHEMGFNRHAETGLSEACRKSKISLTDAEYTLLDFAKALVPHGECPFVGNGVYFYRRFLKHYMPEFESWMSFNAVDVATVEELCRRWDPNVFNGAPSRGHHKRILGNLRDDVKQLKYYKDHFFFSEWSKMFCGVV